MDYGPMDIIIVDQVDSTLIFMISRLHCAVSSPYPEVYEYCTIGHTECGVATHRKRRLDEKKIFSPKILLLLHYSGVEDQSQLQVQSSLLGAGEVQQAQCLVAKQTSLFCCC